MTRLTAWLCTPWGQRCLMLWCMAIQVGNLWVQDAASWGWWIALGGLLFLAAAQGWLEWRRAAGYFKPTLAQRWQIAANDDDPMAAMARMAYLDTLTKWQLRELRDYLRQGVGTGRVVELDDVPQVVKGFVLAGLPPEWREDL